MAETLELLPDADFRRVLCVVAHPDDLEYGTSAAVATWTRRGVEVAYLLLTSGEAGMQRPPEEAGPLRANEQRRACETVGVRDLTILGHPDGMLVYGLDLRRDIARRIREFKPDAVVAQACEIEAPWRLDQADHRASGLAAVDAVRDADNTWVFRDLAEGGLPKWHTSWLLIAGHPRPTHALPVAAEAVDAAVASLRCHEHYLADLPWHPDPGQFIPEMLHGAGATVGVDAAVAFRVHQL